MNTRGYTILGWIIWQVASRVVKWQLGQKRTKIGAAGIVAAVLAAGVAAAAKAHDDE